MPNRSDKTSTTSKLSRKQRAVKRKLTAIFSADVQGYSRLMETDEEYTVSIVTSHRNLMAGLIEQYQGRVVDSPGDNVLAEFASALDAVNCAIEVQRRIRQLNLEIPEDRKMLFRIGINLGDVIVEGERIYGDGVNVASRLEGLAEGGGVCVSRPVYDQVKKKVSQKFEYLGARTVRNISEPVRVYKIQLVDDPNAAPSEKVQYEARKSISKDTLLEIRPILLHHTPEAFSLAFTLLNKETEKQPADSEAKAMTAYILWEAANQGWLKDLGIGYFESRSQARLHLKACEGQGSPWGNMVNSEIKILRRDFSGAIKLAREALEPSPSDPTVLSWLAYALTMAGRPMEAVPYGREAIKNNPANPALHFSRLALAYLSMGQMPEAVGLFAKATEKNLKMNSLKPAHAVALVYSGKKEEARKLLDQYRTIWPVLPNIRRVMFFWPFKDKRTADFFAEGLTQARLPGKVSDCLYCQKEQKLTGSAIRSTFFGKTMTGFDPWTGRQEWVMRDKDGGAILYAGRDGQRIMDRGHSRVEKDNLCDCWEERTAGIDVCGPVFRNIREDAEQKDEFILFTDYGFFPMSPV